MNKYLNVQLEDLQGEIRPTEVKLEKSAAKLSDLSEGYDEVVAKKIQRSVKRERNALRQSCILSKECK